MSRHLFSLLTVSAVSVLKQWRASVVCLCVLAASSSFAQDKQVAKWDFANGLSGCQPLHHVKLTSKDGVLHVVSTGNDPHFIGPIAKQTAGWKKLVLRLKSDRRLNAQIFWTTTKDSGTSEARSVRFRINAKNKDWVEHTVYFHTKSKLTRLRLDPHSAPCEIEIDSITVFDSTAPPAEPATDPAGFKTLPGFKVELLYSVPAITQGSWVSMTVDDKGRLITCDQYGSLYRVTPSRQESKLDKIEPLGVKIGSAQGLLYAFDALYVMVNKGKDSSGLYRVSSTKNDDNFDKVELLQSLTGALGEHGPHGIRLSPDGKSLYVVAGNNTLLPEIIKTYRLPKNWAEDQLLLRDPCSNGHNTGRLAPGGWVCKVSPDGKEWELVAAGFRNPYDIAFNRDGELFTYDADMEMDVGTPWYRPTRVCHVVSGGEFGWRWGTGKWPSWSPDSLPAVADIGMGSPTGVAFGYEANFPRKYQDALYVCDWTYGRLFAVHLHPSGGSYDGELEEFITGTPLPLTDIVVNPQDKAMYFTIGGRRTQSGLYRVTYTGPLATQPDAGVIHAKEYAQAKKLRDLRHRLEALHAAPDLDEIKFIQKNLSHTDRHIRYAARIALEHLGAEFAELLVKNDSGVDLSIQSALALARTGTDTAQSGSIHVLAKLAEKELSTRQMIDLLRTAGVAFARHGIPARLNREQFRSTLERRYPSSSVELNRELCRMLVYLDSPSVVPKTVGLMKKAVTQEELLAYGMLLRVAKSGWTDELRSSYFKFLNKTETGAATGDYVGGGHFQIYVQRFRAKAVDQLTDAQKKSLDDVINAKLPSTVPTGSPTPRKFVRNWTQADLEPQLDRIGKGRSFDNGKSMFAIANCIQCHRFKNIGGILGPDITGASKRYSRKVMVREIINPSAQISDQFRTSTIITEKGRVFEGRIINRTEKEITVATDPKRPNSVIQLAASDVDEIIPSKTSMMPKDLLNTLSIEEILDLLAYIESGGDPEHSIFNE